jgi:hypothetical protein
MNILLNKAEILYTDDFYDIFSQNNKPSTIILIVFIQNKFDFYKRIGYYEKKFLTLLPNNFINRELFQDYIFNINDYIDDKNDYSVERTITSTKHLIIGNKFKFI